MAAEFTDRVALVTGAAGGIGRASALAFAARGASVVLWDVSDMGETAAMVEGLGAKTLTTKIDVSNGASVREGIDAAIRTFGRLDFAHNNAGISAMAPLADIEEADWSRVIGVNLTGIFLCMKYQMPHLIASGGAIVNTASVWGLQGAGLSSPYVASKHGVVGLTRAAAHDYGPQGVRVNAVAPGPIRTPMTAPAPEEAMAAVVARTRAGRMGEPQEVGEVVAWLCSSAASYINGAILPVDGGYLVT
ncbi:NAD(P)-dependent dehydrogenase (short-subunit alcohol dehydrogenase family) [Sphingomonas vulcanisoli]|uniref:NAD(P)-dependent dehydrogenase (Short-subunit alcohol dehydrogenase family) n=1 Tax=Sphingomonas vulcanisoli TaxID=1658060 RepID=A0ABX0TZV2_9SPHN|nr:SDR family NAD(P)-dependent oxidoreductase [Sphingomonas vulcanisoli]NIJ09280.1 NAD(P)-dependent dehydrogenase (short-subunit alcohol dehydrogenase family) [Sphingomonas vulcanisoli]